MKVARSDEKQKVTAVARRPHGGKTPRKKVSPKKDEWSDSDDDSIEETKEHRRGKTSGMSVRFILCHERMDDGCHRFRVLCEDEKIIWMQKKEVMHSAPEILEDYLNNEEVSSSGSDTNEGKRSREIIQSQKKSHADRRTMRN